MAGRQRIWKRWVLILIGIICSFSGGTAAALQSSNYRIDESAIGTGNMLQSSSAHFQARDGINDLAVGASGSSNYQILGGSKTDPYPWLTFSINSSSSNLGVLSSTTTGTATASFSVENYTSYGYVVQITGTPPTNGVHSLPAMSALGPSQTGIEQFGINLVANTSPINPLGANPDNGQFGYGTVLANYASNNNFYYADGDTIAKAPKSSGVTTYTISFIVNVAPLTPGGIYASNQALVVTGTY